MHGGYTISTNYSLKLDRTPCSVWYLHCRSSVFKNLARGNSAVVRSLDCEWSPYPAPNHTDWVYTMRRQTLFYHFLRCRRTADLVVSRAPVARTSASTAAATVQTEQETSVKPFEAIPGPKPLPVLRNLLEFRRNSKRINQFLGECYEKYGEIFKLEAPGRYW